MKLKISRPAALGAALVAIVARVFLALALDSGPLHNGMWLSALLGALPAMLWLACLDAKPASSPLCLSLLPVVLLDGGVVLSVIVRTAGYLALDRVPAIGLALPVCLAVLWCACRNGDAVGYGALLWTRIFPLLLLLVVLLQAGHYRPEWLRPWLGNGWREIARGGIASAGSFVPASAVLLTAEAPSGKPDRRPVKAAALGAAAIVAALLLVLRLMMAPTSIAGEAWLNRLDALLTNGRAPLYLQLPMIVLWYGGLLHLLLLECFTGATLLQGLAPRFDGRLCAALAVAAAGAISASGLPAMLQGGDGLQWAFILAAMLTAGSILIGTIRKGEGRCAR